MARARRRSRPPQLHSRVDHRVYALGSVRGLEVQVEETGFIRLRRIGARRFYRYHLLSLLRLSEALSRRMDHDGEPARDVAATLFGAH